MTIRELAPGESGQAYLALLELRPHLAGREDFARRVDELQRPEGFRLVASFADDPAEAAACAGFRTGHNTAWGHFLYVDDLSTRADHRRQGHADRLMRWLLEEAARLGCEGVHLDTGHQRFDAHRLYLRHGLRITAHHLQVPLGGAGHRGP